MGLGVAALLASMVPSVCLLSPGFLLNLLDLMGTIPDVHMSLENDIADFLGTEAAILYSQGFSTVSSVIPAFCKRGDIIVADRAVNFAIQKGIEISRSTVRWYDHNDLNSLEEVLLSIEKERKRRRGPLTRRFIVTEGIFQKDGTMVDLPKLVCVFFGLPGLRVPLNMFLLRSK